MLMSCISHLHSASIERAPIPALIGPSRQCACNAFDYDVCGDHLQTCRVKSAASQVHDLVVYRLGDILGSVGHKVKIHNHPGYG